MSSTENICISPLFLHLPSPSSSICFLLIYIHTYIYKQKRNTLDGYSEFTKKIFEFICANQFFWFILHVDVFGSLTKFSSEKSYHHQNLMICKCLIRKALILRAFSWWWLRSQVLKLLFRIWVQGAYYTVIY